MQLKAKAPRHVRGQLALATCSLLAGTAHAVDSADLPWKVDSALLYYAEKDRVSVIEPVVNMKKTLAEGEFVTLRLVFDSMSGASPTGASPTSTAQTFTTPSGNSTYTILPGELPARDFNDVRYAIGADWEKPLTSTTRNILSTNISAERDYSSFGISNTLAHDINNRLTTLSAGIGASFDTVAPEGSVPMGLQLLSATPAGGDDSKTLLDVLLGVTHVLTPRAIMQLNFSHSSMSGYLTDPYKILSVVDPTTGTTLDYRYEKRPDTRSTNSVYWKVAYHLPRDVVHFSYRYFWDDWEVKSHTADVRYRFELGAGRYLESHLRYYSQTAASFYRHSLVNGQPLPQYASADYRLAEMQGNTIGLKFGMPAGKGGETSIRIERMTQTGDDHPANAIGVQRNYDLYPQLDVTTLLISYSTRF